MLIGRPAHSARPTSTPAGHSVGQSDHDLCYPADRCGEATDPESPDASLSPFNVDQTPATPSSDWQTY